MIGEKKERTSPSTYPLLGIFAHHIRAYAIRPYSLRRKTNTKRHDASPYPQRTKGKYVGAYRIRPPWQHARLLHSPFAHIRAYAIRPYNWWRKTNTKRHDASPYPQRTKGKYVGAYRIRPPWQQAREMFRVDSMGKPCSVSEEHFPKQENLARIPGNISPGGKTLLGFRGTFPRAGKPCSVSEEHFPERENLARFPRNISPGGKTLLGFRGTFPRAGKPCSCRARGERFPERGNLAALVGNIFPSGKTLPRSWGTFSQAGKPCRAPRQHFYEHRNLAALRGDTFTGMETLLRFAATLL